MKTTQKRVIKPSRLKFPDEAKYEWLPMLLDAFHIVDTWVLVELEAEEKRRKTKVACHKGCSSCCLKPRVPITPLEIVGLSWFCSEKMEEPFRGIVKSQILSQNQSTQCPFLVDNICSVYLVRPLSCRIFFMLDALCVKNEDPFETRPQDMWHPSIEVARKSAYKMFPYYGINNKKNMDKAFENGYILKIAKEMHLCDLKPIYDIMELFDSAKKGGESI